MTVDLDNSPYERTCGHEALLRRSVHQDSPSCPSRHLQVRGRSPFWCESLLGQTLREIRQPGRVLRPEKGWKKAAENRRGDEEASRRGREGAPCRLKPAVSSRISTS